jgi:hypothetical protein
MASYSLEEFKELVAASNWSYFNETRPFKHLEKLGWGKDELVDVLLSLHTNDFKKSFPNERVHHLLGRDTIPADQYVIFWDIDEWVRRSYAWVQGHYPCYSIVELSIKIAIAPNGTGNLAGVVTFHDSMSP